ncbi:MAG: glutamate-1-semialdehyde 2,1-aminomutase [Deltaproteobacteria bacterium]|nr:glutamate-1-semialdehyde 2,1-aminomutase [Deltaproteobacteria bacterium]
MRSNSEALFARGFARMPGGVNSPVRAFRAVGGNPVFIAKGAGSRIYDVDGNSYLDFLSSWGPMILGHAHPVVVAALIAAAHEGTSFGATTEREVIMAEMLCEAVPSLEKVRLVNSGTEAVMSAVRLARAFTNRDMIIKFDGCYHGHSDSLLVQAGSGVATLGIPDSQGVPLAIAAQTRSLPYNDIPALLSAFAKYDSRIAAVIVEPVAGNMGVVKGSRDFLAAARELTSTNGALLIFDEVITGFRFGYGGYQDIIGITPDITCLGKIIGGGLPVGAFGGKEEIMSLVAPLGGVYQAGTLAGNPLAMAAGIATLELLQEASYQYEDLERKTFGFCQEIQGFFAAKGIAVVINQAGSAFTCFFTEGQSISDFATAKQADTKAYGAFFHRLLANGLYFPPAQFEAAFFSFAHSDADIALALEGVKKAIQSL